MDETGFIYLAVNKSMPGLVKIGMTGGDVHSRMRELSGTGAPSPFECAYFCEVQNPAKVERQLHKAFSFCRESNNREFFRVDWRAVQAALQMMQKSDGKFISGSEKTSHSKIGKFTLIKWVKEGNAENVRHVLSIGGKPDQADENGMTALMWAAELGNGEIIKILLEEDANPGKADKDGRTALMFVSGNNCADIIRMLADAGADVNAETQDGETAIHYAAYYGDAEVVQALLSARADPNAVNDDGKTALMEATEEGHAEVVKALLLAEADVNAADNDGKTALTRANWAKQMRGRRNDSEIVRILEEAGAK